MMRLLVGLCFVFLIGCDKPTEENCRKAIANMQSVLGTEHLTSEAELQGEVRRCRGGSTKESVECAIEATTLDELRACGFATIPDQNTAPAGSAAEPASGEAAGAAAKPGAGAAQDGAAPATGGSAPGAGAAAAGSAAE